MSAAEQMLEDDGIPWAQAPEDARLAQLGKLFVERDIEDRIVAKIDEARRDRLIYSEARNVVITGPTGVGKSQIAERYLAANPEHRDPETGCIVRPVLYVDVRVASTPSSVAKAIIRKLGLDIGEADTWTDDTPEGEKKKRKVTWARDAIAELSYTAKKQMVGQKVEVVLLDEFHNTIPNDGKHTLNIIADWVRDFAKAKTRSARHPNGLPGENIVFVMIGVNKVRNIIDPTVNGELFGLTPYTEEIDRYRYGTPAEKDDFRAFLNELDEQLPFDEDSSLGHPALADKLHHVTFGFLRQLGHIVPKAGELAVRDGSGYIHERHLYAAVELMRGVLESHLVSADSKGEERRAVENPFTPPSLPKRDKPQGRRGYRQ